jgi:hypothetical protein
MEYLIGIGSSITTTLLLGGLAFLGKNWFIERLKLSLQKEHTKFQEQLQWERKVKEQAERVAEYLALARQLSEESTKDDYIRANQLSWELAMWLPDEIYKKAVHAIAQPNSENNELSTVIEVRALLLKKEAGSLTQDDIPHHAPGIGKDSN